MTSKDYQLFDLTPEADLEEIKKAYRKLTLLYHPDKCGGDNTIYQKVKTAYKAIFNMKTGQGNCYTHEEFKNQYKEHISKKDNNKKDDNNKNDCDLVSNFDIQKFNQTFEQNGGAWTGAPSGISRGAPSSVPSGGGAPPDFGRTGVGGGGASPNYIDNYKAFVPNSNNVLGQRLYADNPESFAGAFNAQFDHLNKNTLKKYTGDPQPIIGGFTALFDDTKPEDTVPSSGDGDNMLWNGGLDHVKFAKLGDDMNLAKNPENVEQLLPTSSLPSKRVNKDDCPFPDLTLKLKKMQEERKAALLATAKNLTKLPPTK